MTLIASVILALALFNNVSGAAAYSCWYNGSYSSAWCGPRNGYAWGAGAGILAFFTILIFIWICVYMNHTSEWQKNYVLDAEARAADMQQTRTTYAQPSIPIPAPVHQNMQYTYDINNSGNQTGNTAGSARNSTFGSIRRT